VEVEVAGRLMAGAGLAGVCWARPAARAGRRAIERSVQRREVIVFADLYATWMQLSETCFATRFEVQRRHAWPILAHTRPIPRNGTSMQNRLFGPLRARRL